MNIFNTTIPSESLIEYVGVSPAPSGPSRGRARRFPRALPCGSPNRRARLWPANEATLRSEGGWTANESPPRGPDLPGGRWSAGPGGPGAERTGEGYGAGA